MITAWHSLDIAAPRTAPMATSRLLATSLLLLAVTVQGQGSTCAVAGEGHCRTPAATAGMTMLQSQAHASRLEEEQARGAEHEAGHGGLQERHDKHVKNHRHDKAGDKSSEEKGDQGEKSRGMAKEAHARSQDETDEGETNEDKDPSRSASGSAFAQPPLPGGDAAARAA